MLFRPFFEGICPIEKQNWIGTGEKPLLQLAPSPIISDEELGRYRIYVLNYHKAMSEKILSMKAF